jgi:hypothetical protein
LRNQKRNMLVSRGLGGVANAVFKSPPADATFCNGSRNVSFPQHPPKPERHRVPINYLLRSIRPGAPFFNNWRTKILRIIQNCPADASINYSRPPPMPHCEKMPQNASNK